MAEPDTIHPLTQPVPTRRPTLPPETGPPHGYQRPTNGWDAASEGLRQAGAGWQRHQERASERQPRPPASTLSIVNSVVLVFLVIVGVGLVVGHQLGASGYEQRQLDRHNELVIGIYGIIDKMAVHHPEAREIENEMRRARRKSE